LVVLVTKREETPVWKASPLVWLLRDFELAGQSVESMEEKSKHIHVTLLKGPKAKIEVIAANDAHEDKLAR
jgi:hypothetical protein